MMIHAKIPKSKPKKAPKAQREQYENWLKSHQPTKKLSKITSVSLSAPAPYRRTTQKIDSLNTWVTGSLSKSGIMSEYHKLSAKDRELVDNISKSVAPLHKSNYVYVSEGMNPASLGRKNEVL